MAQQPEKRAEKKLRYRDRVAGGRVYDGDAQLGGSRNVDVVGAHSRSSDDAQARRVREKRCG